MIIYVYINTMNMLISNIINYIIFFIVIIIITIIINIIIIGRTIFLRKQENHFTLGNFMRSQLFTALGALRTGMDILFDNEKVKIDSLTGHGGFFKTADVGLKVMAAAMHTSVSALETAGEGGPWGMALLAAYLVRGNGKALSDWLNEEVFASAKKTTVAPEQKDIDGFNAFFKNYKAGLPVLKAAVENI